MFLRPSCHTGCAIGSVLIFGLLSLSLPVFSEGDANSANSANKLFNQGLKSYQQGKYLEALKPLKQVIQINPKDEMALILLGIIQLQLDTYNEAENYFRTVLRINPKNVDALNNLSLVYYKQGRTSDALGQLRQSLAIQPDNVDTLKNLATIYLDVQNTDEAIKMYQRILKIDPKQEKIYGTLAYLYFQKNMLDDVIRMYNAAGKKMSGGSDALTNLGFAYFYKGDVSRAAKYFNNSLRINPGKAETHFGLGLINYKQANLDAAIKEFRQALSQRKNYPEALRQLAYSYEDKGSYIKALYYYHLLLKQLPEDKEAQRGYLSAKKKAVDYYLRKGSEAYFDGDFKTALVHWSKVKKLDPKNQNALKFMATARNKLGREIKKHNDQAESYYLQKRYQDAYQEWNYVLKLSSRNNLARQGLKKLSLKQKEKNEIRTSQGLKYAERGDVKSAISEFRSTLKTDPNNLIAKQYIDKLQTEQKSEAEKYYRKGIELYSQGKLREAIENLEVALDVSPKDQRTKNLLYKARTQLRDNVKALLARGVELANAGRVVEAKDKFNEVLKADPGNSDAQEYLAKLTGKAARASVNKEEIKKLYYDGVSLYLDGQNRRAIEVWQKILLLDPENQEAKSSIAKAEMELKEMEKRGIKIE